MRHSLRDIDSLHFSEWRKVPFQDNLWELSFGNNTVILIDFNIKINDGTLLTDKSNEKLLYSIKLFICLQTHPSVGCQDLSSRSAKNIISKSLHILDFLLLQGPRINLKQLDLSHLTPNDYKIMLSRISSSPRIEESIYQWSERLSNFLRINSSALPDAQLSELTAKYPILLAKIQNCSECQLNLTEDEVFRARAWLWVNGYYKYHPHGWSPNTRRLSTKLYINTFRGVANKRVPPELILMGPTSSPSNEFDRAPVRSRSPLDGRMPMKHLHIYHQSAQQLGNLRLADLPCPDPETFDVALESLYDNDETPTSGRFISLPHAIVLDAIKKACEFIIEFGVDILTALTDIKIAAYNAGIASSALIREHGVHNYVSQSLLEKGVAGWTARGDNLVKHSRYDDERLATGIWDLGIVLYGAIQVLTGTLMAKRQAELIRLRPSNCSSKFISFDIGKTGVKDFREVETYPVQSFNAMAIDLLRCYQENLLAAGVITEEYPIFSPPSARGRGLRRTSAPFYNSAIDAFCDYFQLPLNENGQRYYIRQHQLRRFFAQTFFWNYSHGEAETLTWFLGHASREQFYHYITEITPGSILTRVKSEHALHGLKNGSDDTSPLISYIESRFGTKNVSVISDDELNEYLDSLQNDGTLGITPHFYTVDNINKHRIMIEIHDIAGHIQNQGH
ncbi:TPA: hypothetical protein ACHIYU_002659 [Pseudomonas aeruginosa]|uniref:hypothetical protein n=1 Tax=Pseudomonas TaxID=286 RepID=UPI000F4FFCDB|nr:MULTISPECIES: hypothetical protein [Pseudomonas]EKX2958317.1 hypothetical protein [Pseudomonas aeruginosa]MBI6936927.1 hypothetical protein [Pseudomonas aeruginosa]MBV6241898.1 hypothetical protein [Pseudomonas aeruginosa]MCC0148483.1 hypothetical protein [Pseudomonas aeruginosa]MCO1937524.1 hypothetical protein [Pseudomonas aeruginosa]